MVKKMLIGVVFTVLMATSLNAQNYRTALGGRFGLFNGFTIKHFIKTDRALEGLLGFRWNGFMITGLYEYQKPFPDVKNLDWFVGIGGHVGFWNDGYYKDRYYNDGHSAFGLDLIGGLEYTFDEVPINLGLDWKPAFNFVGNDNVWLDGLALSVRYTIK